MEKLTNIDNHMKHTINLVFKKSTKNTFVFEEILDPGQAPIIPTVYIRKWALPNQPTNVTLTLEVDN